MRMLERKMISRRRRSFKMITMKMTRYRTSPVMFLKLKMMIRRMRMSPKRKFSFFVWNINVAYLFDVQIKQS